MLRFSRPPGLLGVVTAALVVAACASAGGSPSSGDAPAPTDSRAGY